MDINVARERARGCLVGMAVIAADEAGKQGNRTGVQLTQIVAESLVRKRRFDLTDQIKSLVDAYRKGPMYWGPSTLQAAEEYAQHLATRGQDGRAPHHRMTIAPADPTHCDLDVACKIAPIAIFHAVRHPRVIDPFLTDVMELGFMTHGDPRATIAAAVIAMGIWNLMGFDTIPKEFPFVNGFRHDVSSLVYRLEKEYTRHMSAPETVGSAIKHIWKCAESFDDIVDHFPGTSYALEGVPFALATYLHRPLNFVSAVRKAASADSSYGATSGLVGALSGVTVGLAGIPPDWVNASPSAASMRDLADRLVDAARHP